MLEPEFANKIKRIRQKQIILGGIETHICVLQTPADLIKRRF